MLARWRAAGLVWPTLLTLALLPVLIGLGAWQWQRKAWKEDLIAKVETRRTAEPIPYNDLALSANPADAEYLHVRVAGAFDHARERHVYAPRSSGPGWHVYTLFLPEGGAPRLFVNRGWVPEALKDPTKREEGQIAGQVTVAGLLRTAEKKSLFTPDNDMQGNRWYSRDLEAMQKSVERARAAASPDAPAAGFAPFALDADAEPSNPGGWPKGGVTEVHLSNPHLQYVVTWYGLALTLVAVFIVFARQRLAELGPPSHRH